MGFKVLSSRLYSLVSSQILSLVDHPKTTFVWSDGDAVIICVRDGIATILYGDNIAPPLTGNHYVFLYLILLLLVLDLKRSSDAGSNCNFIQEFPFVFQDPKFTGASPLSKCLPWMAAVYRFILGCLGFSLGRIYLLYLYDAGNLGNSGRISPFAMSAHVTTWWCSMHRFIYKRFIPLYP